MAISTRRNAVPPQPDRIPCNPDLIPMPDFSSALYDDARREYKRTLSNLDDAEIKWFMEQTWRIWTAQAKIWWDTPHSAGPSSTVDHGTVENQAQASSGGSLLPSARSPTVSRPPSPIPSIQVVPPLTPVAAAPAAPAPAIPVVRLFTPVAPASAVAPAPVALLGPPAPPAPAGPDPDHFQFGPDLLQDRRSTHVLHSSIETRLPKLQRVPLYHFTTRGLKNQVESYQQSVTDHSYHFEVVNGTSALVHLRRVSQLFRSHRNSSPSSSLSHTVKFPNKARPYPSPRPNRFPPRTPWTSSSIPVMTLSENSSNFGAHEQLCLRPNVPARLRLKLWKPKPKLGRILADDFSLTAPKLQTRVVDVLADSLKDSTLQTYGSDYIAGIRAWHVLHRVPWSINETELKSLLRGADSLTPDTSKRPAREPYTPAMMSILRAHLNLSDPLDAAVFACITTSFYSCARLREFTLPTQSAFLPHLHVKPSDVSERMDRQGRQVRAFTLPGTKTAPNGEEVFWAAQEGPTDPLAAFQNHLDINSPPLNGPFIRIGATLEYLLRGVPFDVVNAIGRWASDAFTLYLRKHAQILAPYLQATREVHGQFIRLTMPPPR
ncbi:hypothetical protein ACEPAI_3260 [Sanghuangporus weigelae]